MATIVPRGAHLSDEQVAAILDDPAAHSGPDARAPGGINLRYITAAIRANALLIGAIMAVCLVSALVLTLLDTPRYTAEATVQINTQADQVLSQQQEASQEGANVYDQDRFLQTQIDILQSRGLSQRVAQRLKLQDDADFYQAMNAKPPAPGTSPNVAREDTISLLLNNLKADLPRNSRIVSIRFISTSPETSARIANAFAEEFIAANLQRKFDSSAYARSFVADQLADAKHRLEVSEVALNNYARQNALIRTRDAIGGSDGDHPQVAGSVTTASLVQINEAANQARAARIAAEGRWRAVTRGSALDSEEALQNPAVQSLLEQRADVRARLQQERAKHLEDHPAVIQLVAQASSVDDQLRALAEAVRASVRTRYDSALGTEHQLEQQVALLKTDTLAEQDRSVQYNLLAREADTNRTIYDGLLQRFKELNAASGISASNLSIIDRADVPLSPSSPNLLINLLVALVVGMGIAGLVVLFRDQFDDSIRVPEDVESKLQLPLLGVIPKVEADPKADFEDPKSAISESYNSLGGSLLYSTAQGLPETILITSAQSSEGKSTTSFAIASNLARIGKRVVLIDLDLRRPSLHRTAGTDNAHGMTTVLTTNDPIDAVLVDSGKAGLSLITSGPIPPSPTELIASPRMQRLIDDLASAFDVVVIDSPPVLGLADAPLLSALVDGVVLVVEADRSRRGTLKSSLRRLRTMRPILLGAVLTKFDPRKAANRYSEYYGYEYYQYGYEDKSGERAG